MSRHWCCCVCVCVCPVGTISDLQPPRMGQSQGVQPEACTTAKAAAAAATSDSAAAAPPLAALPVGKSLQLRGPKKQQKQKRPTPPFLKYKWPKGVRGKAIVWLLLAVAVPSVLLLLLVSRGVAGGEDTLFLSGGCMNTNTRFGALAGQHRQHKLYYNVRAADSSWDRPTLCTAALMTSRLLLLLLFLLLLVRPLPVPQTPRASVGWLLGPALIATYSCW